MKDLEPSEIKKSIEYTLFDKEQRGDWDIRDWQLSFEDTDGTLIAEHLVSEPMDPDSKYDVIKFKVEVKVTKISTERNATRPD